VAPFGVPGDGIRPADRSPQGENDCFLPGPCADGMGGKHPARIVRLSLIVDSEEKRMKNVFWLIVGVGAGFVVAHEINKSQRGRDFFEDVDSRIREFTETIGDAYKEREAELKERIDTIVDEAQDTLDELRKN
jgi:hypothetical protein